MGRSDEQQLHFVLVHGAQHGAWCWYKTKSLLEAAGHRVSAPDLTSAGISPVSADDVKSFDHYNQPLYDVLESLIDTEMVILVGHSYGGVVVARATERYARKIHVAVYIAGCMLCSEQPMSEVWPQVFEEFEGDMRFSFGRGTEASPTSGWVVDETARRTYFGSCSPKDVQLGMLLLRPTPLMTDDATAFTERGYRSVARVYIRTSLDSCLKPEFQELLIQRNRPREVRTIELAGHAPQLCAAKELHHHLVQIAATYVNPDQSS